MEEAVCVAKTVSSCSSESLYFPWIDSRMRQTAPTFFCLLVSMGTIISV
jgi:hypothetical protein